MNINAELLEKVKEQKLHRLINQKYRYYIPIGKVEEFIDNFGSDKNFVSLLSAANGIGKTRAGTNVLAHLMYPCNNPFFTAPLFKKWPYPKRARIISDPTTITDTIIPEIKDQFPKDRWGIEKYETLKSGKRYEYEWKTDTGWEFNLMTYEQDVKEFESATLGLAWFDEPPPQPIYKATVARMRRGGVIFITATPLTGSAWMYDDIIVNQDNEAKSRYFLEADVEDACKEHGIRGFLEHEDIVKMINQYDPDDLQARIFGKFQHLTGLIYKKYSDKIHVLRPFEINKRDHVVIELVDTHPRNPDAVTWIAVDKQGRHFIVDELYGSWETPEFAQKIKDKAANFRIVRREIDPSAFNEDQHMKAYENSLAKRLALHGLIYYPASKNRTAAIRITKDYLDYQQVGNYMVKPPMLYVFDNCKRHRYEFTHWQWENWQGKTAQYKALKEKPMDKDDHMMENTGRGLLAGIKWTPYVDIMDLNHPLIERRNKEETKSDPYD
jgi:phage terminase large subunit-like protein